MVLKVAPRRRCKSSATIQAPFFQCLYTSLNLNNIWDMLGCTLMYPFLYIYPLHCVINPPIFGDQLEKWYGACRTYRTGCAAPALVTARTVETGFF